MIDQLREGHYQLVETKDGTKVLYLDQRAYAWIDAENIGEILVWSTDISPTRTYICEGRYRLYNIKDEPDLHDTEHLELEYQYTKWQGYLLLTGLPSPRKKRARIIPTSEIISSRAHAGPAWSVRKPELAKSPLLSFNVSSKGV